MLTLIIQLLFVFDAAVSLKSLVLLPLFDIFISLLFNKNIYSKFTRKKVMPRKILTRNSCTAASELTKFVVKNLLRYSILVKLNLVH